MQCAFIHCTVPWKSYSEKPNTTQQCIKLLLFLILNKAQHVSGDTPPIIRSLKLHKHPLVLHTWKVAGRAVVGCCQVAYATWQRPTAACLTTFHVCKTRGCLCSFRLLMMGGVSPETCWASSKIRIKKILIHCCILLGSWLWELWYDAQIHEHQVLWKLMFVYTMKLMQLVTLHKGHITGLNLVHYRWKGKLMSRRFTEIHLVPQLF